MIMLLHDYAEKCFISGYYLITVMQRHVNQKPQRIADPRAEGINIVPYQEDHGYKCPYYNCYVILTL